MASTNSASSVLQGAIPVIPRRRRTDSKLEQVIHELQRVPGSETAPVACKVCGGASSLFGVVDFHKSCEEARGKRMALSGLPVYYRQCRRCSFVFTTTFDAWGIADFRSHIYNADYVLVDPDYVEARPTANARLIAESFAATGSTMQILDYGGGTGLLAERLRGRGFHAESFDPILDRDGLPSGRFDLVTAFEVLEHVPQPRETVANMAALLKGEGAILFSTLVQPAEFAREGLAWWYAAPRNGHISLYSTAALAWLFKPLGMKVVSFSAALHMAYARVPAFASHLRLPA